MLTNRFLPHKLYITGGFCAGKDTVADVLVAEYGYKKINYADALKDEFCLRRGITREYLEANKGEYRSALQHIGQGRREENPNYWINLREKQAAFFKKTVCADLSYVNESYDAMLGGGFCVRLDVAEGTRVSRYYDKYGCLPTREQIGHESELSRCYHCPVHTNVYSALLTTYEIIDEIERAFRGHQNTFE